MSTITQRIEAIRAPLLRYERHLSAAAMVAGFGIDNLTFGRVDHPGAHIIFAGYLAIAAGSIGFAHALQARADRKDREQAGGKLERPATIGASLAPPSTLSARVGVPQVSTKPGRETPAAPKSSRLRIWLPAATQFALGGLWSGFLVFYSRSAVLAASWPFLLLLLGFLVGNEVFRKYHSRFVFASLLLFFALYSYAVFVVPVFTKTIGRLTFLASGGLAILCFLGFLRFIAALDRERFRRSRLAILGGALAITVAMNAFYFTGILPPLPLALSDVGIYHTVKRTGAVYTAAAEAEPWTVAFGFAKPVMHIVPGQPLSLYSAVFAPIKMHTRITHRWYLWDAKLRLWRVASTVSFVISGGREGGYRGYSIKSHPQAGDWRVDIDAEDGRLIGRLAFSVVNAAGNVATVAKTLQ